jgi:DNA-binding NarL/FixJ family response regulator
VKFIFTTMFAEPTFARLAMEAGAKGFVVKHSVWTELVPAILAVLDGKTFVSASVSIVRPAGI